MSSYAWLRFEGNKLKIASEVCEGDTYQDYMDFIRHYKDKNDVQIIAFKLHYFLRKLTPNTNSLAWQTLIETEQAKSDDFHLSFQKDGFFRVKLNNTSVTIYDVWRYFKNYSSVYEVLEAYNTDNLAEVMEQVRWALWEHVDVKIRKPEGPGEAANTLLRQNQTKKHIQATPTEMLAPTRCAMAQGRFETFFVGNARDVWHYDINSAYAYAMSRLPSMKGSWHYTEDPKINENMMSIYHVVGDSQWIEPSHEPQPLWQTALEDTWDENGILQEDQRVTKFERSVDGWFFGPEANLVRYYNDWKIDKGYIWVPESETQPIFKNMVEKTYAGRSEMRASNHAAAPIVKMILTAQVGKFATRRSRFFNARMPIAKDVPPYWQPEWAGYVWAYCRAQLFHAMQTAMDQGYQILACATDGFLCTGRVEGLDVGSELGQWKANHFNSVTVFDSNLWIGYQMKNDIMVETVKASGIQNYEPFSQDLKGFFNKGNLGLNFLIRSKPYNADPLSEKYGERVSKTDEMSIGSSFRSHYPGECEGCKAKGKLHELKLSTEAIVGQVPVLFPWDILRKDQWPLSEWIYRYGY